MWLNIITTNKFERKLSLQSSPTFSPSKTPSPWSKYLYSPTSDSSYSQCSYAESDYSLPHSPSSTRPSSAVSHYTSSCPTTPLSSRKISSSPGPLSPYRSQAWPATPTTPARSGDRGVYNTLFRPDLIRLSDPRRRRNSNSESSNAEKETLKRNFKNLKLDLDEEDSRPKTHLHSKMEAEISHKCDQLLQDLESDLQNFNFTTKKRNKDALNVKTSATNKTQNSRQVFYINKVKMVELETDALKAGEAAENKNIEMNNNNQDYFDNLIKIIENAAKNLSE